jgi:hypothetical protein
VIILGINRDRGNNILDFRFRIADLDYTSLTKGGLNRSMAHVGQPIGFKKRMA